MTPLTWAVRYARTFGILGVSHSAETLLSYLQSVQVFWTLPQNEAAPQWVSSLVTIR